MHLNSMSGDADGHREVWHLSGDIDTSRYRSRQELGSVARKDLFVLDGGQLVFNLKQRWDKIWVRGRESSVLGKRGRDRNTETKPCFLRFPTCRLL